MTHFDGLFREPIAISCLSDPGSFNSHGLFSPALIREIYEARHCVNALKQQRFPVMAWCRFHDNGRHQGRVAEGCSQGEGGGGEGGRGKGGLVGYCLVSVH